MAECAATLVAYSRRAPANIRRCLENAHPNVPPDWSLKSSRGCRSQVDAIATNEAFFDGLLRAVMPDADRNVPAKYYDGGATIQACSS